MNRTSGPHRHLLLFLAVMALAAIGVVPGRAQSCGGDETVLVQVGSLMRYRANSGPDDAPIVQFGSQMKYIANLSDPGIAGATWTGEAFSDSGWSEGSYGVGYELSAGGAQNLIQTLVPAHAYSVFTRARFTVDDPTAINGAFIGADYDDGVIAWVNGVEVYRSPEMPAGTPAWNTDAALHESSNAATPNYGSLVNISGLVLPALHAGENVLAVGVWNSAAATSTDLVVVPRLSLVPDWTRADFDDSAAPWADGLYGVGYDTDPSVNALALISTSVPTTALSVFTRTRFSVVDAGAIHTLFIGADYDDGYVTWINGVEVFGSAEMPAGRLPWNAGAALHESSNGTTPHYGTLHDISERGIPALHDGTNILAIGVWNVLSSPQSTDLVLIPRLSTGEADACNGLDDNCNGLVDEGFPNFDHDALADCVDPDDDNDGIDDVADCAPFDSSNAAPPVQEVRDLHWSRNDVRTEVLSWQDQGAGVRYDLASGLISALRPDGGVVNGICLADDLGVATYDDARPGPPLGDARYYIVRAEKPPSCGIGTDGVATSGVPRTLAVDCP